MLARERRVTSDSELREAVARAERHVASLRAAVVRARRDAERRRQLWRTVLLLSAIGMLGLGGSFAVGSHLTNDERERAERLVRGSHGAEISSDRSETDRCEAAREKAGKQTEECRLEVMVLTPYTQARVQRGCRCIPTDPLCECP